MIQFLLIVSTRKKLAICLIAMFFILLSSFIITKLDFSKTDYIKKAEAKTVLSAENENRHLKNVLSSILPSESNVLFENNDREIINSYSDTLNSKCPLSEIIKKGKSLPYLFVYTDENYQRPIYSSIWEQAYYQGWLYLPKKIISARHNIFAYTGDSAMNFNLEGELGFYPSVSLDTQNYVNLLIYNFDIQNIIQFENQIAISGTPIKKGVQIISIKTDDIRINTDGTDQILVELCTPKGYGLDYKKIKLEKAPDGEEDFGSVRETYLKRIHSESNNLKDNTDTNIKKNNTTSIDEINKQNELLKKELTHYISDTPKALNFQYNGSYQTSSVLNTTIDLEYALKSSSDINFKISYNNKEYQRPVFHPLWKENSDRDWCYIPRKLYINMKKLFILPSNEALANDLCGELGFFEEYPAINNDLIGMLINNFSVSNVSIFENNILVYGVPLKQGIQIVNIEKTNLTKYKEYAVRLVTKDFCELDIDVIKN